MQTPQEWKAFLKEKNIGYVVRSAEFPDAIAAPLKQLEERGELVPFASADVQNFQGNRIQQNRFGVPVVILKVKH